MADRQVSFVTGANRGIGLEVVRQFVGLDHAVVLASRVRARGEAALAQAGLPADRVLVVELDVASGAQQDFDAAVQQAVDRFGRLDVLVNNAGVDYDVHRRAVEARVDEVEQTFAVNLFGAWRMAVAAVPQLRRSRRGRLVNVSSGAGAFEGMGAGTPAYAASKAALNALTVKFAAELAAHGVLCNAVCPGWVATDMGGGGREIPEGARGVVWAATLPDDGPTGGFFRDGRRIAW